jgi:hypothetical protein
LPDQHAGGRRRAAVAASPRSRAGCRRLGHIGRQRERAERRGEERERERGEGTPGGEEGKEGVEAAFARAVAVAVPGERGRGGEERREEASRLGRRAGEASGRRSD